jgi:hypothetical protein
MVRAALRFLLAMKFVFNVWLLYFCVASVVDQWNHRVLYFPSGSTTAVRVYGQGGSFIICTPNTGGVSAGSMQYPFSAVLDHSANLYVADEWNSRVLYFPANSTVAVKVYGQSSFTAGSINGGGDVAVGTLYYPLGVALDASERLYAADWNNNRVVSYAV